MDRFVVVETADELASVLGETPSILGNGSNLLAPDDGLRGTVVRLAGAFRELAVVEERGDEVSVRIGAGLLNAVALARLARLGLCGAPMLAGVPGTIGGAVAMNAGTTLGEIAEVLERIEGIGRDGAQTIERSGLPMVYRDGGLPAGFVVTAAVLRLRRSGFADEQARVATHLARRKATQPLDLPSCGSVFRNPPGDYAGRLIELVGLKGHRIGDAQISPRHANFIVNLGEARAEHVMACIRTAWSAVREATGVALEPEVRVVGAWDPAIWPLLPHGGASPCAPVL
jgi:UDP-N-acetylmuramate dehydrogenase